MFRTVTHRLASIISAAALTLIPSLLHAQKALVYCPVGIDAAGCNAIVAAITADAARFPGSADAGYDGTQGTVDLATVDLSGYAVFVVPSLADGAGVTPYALLRNGTIAGRIRAAFMGRAAVWSGTPDVGSTNRGAKDQLIRNLAAWAREDSAGTHGPGVVALEDNSDDASTRYNWLGGISAMSLTADTTLDVYSNVQVLTATGRTILTNSAGLQIGYTNMASFGLFRGGDANVATDDATGGRTARVVLVTAAGDPSDPNIATIRTDREDYQPGDTVTVTGSGWEPGETVSLLFHEEVDPPIHPDKSLSALADSLGHIYNRQYEIDDADLGVRFTITATGEKSGRVAQATFTDAKSNSVTVGAQSPNPVFVGSAASYPVTIGFNGNNTNCTTTLSASGLPAGVTPSFSPNPVTGSTTATSTLTLTTSGTTPAGTTTFTVTSTDGACQTSGGASGSGTLVVAAKINTTTSVSSGLNPSTYGQSVTFTATVTRVSGTTTPSGTVQFKDGAADLGAPQPTSGSGASVTATFTAVGTALTAGGHSITAIYSGNATFNGSTSAILTQTVNKANQTITFGALAVKTYGDAPITVTATASSGLTVTFTASGNCTSGGTNGATITITGAGSCTVTAHQVGNADFNAAPDVGQGFTINARPITVTATSGQSKIYGAADPVFAYTVTSGSLVSGDGFTGALTRVAGEAVGTYAIQLGTLSAGNNYTITFVSANFAVTGRPITVTADAGQTKVYGNTDPTFTYTVTSGSLASGDAFTGALSRAAGEAVGTYAIQVGTLSAGTNYILTFVAASLTITARPITVTADPKTKVYGDPDPALTYQITSGSLAFSDAFTGALARAPGESVGTFAITQSTLALSANYSLTFVGANLTITTRPVTVTADPKIKVYGDADPALTYQVTSGTLAFSDAFTGALARAAGETVGGSPYAITQGTLALSANYALTFVGANFSITPRPVTVTADAETKVYGEGDPALTYQITAGNLVFSDAFTGALARAAGENVGGHAIQQGTLALATDYTLTYVGADLTITARPITVTADPKSKVYGEADPTLTYQITGGSLAFSDAFTGAPTRAAGESVAGNPYAIQQGTLALSANYSLTFIGADFTITARPVTVTADAKTKVYGEADPALTYQITSGSLAFSDAFAGALTRVAGESVAGSPYAIQQGTLALSTNYTLTFLGAALSITPRPVTVTADAKAKVYGDADPALTYQITSGSLAFSDAFTGALSRTAGEDVSGTPYAIIQGTLTLGPSYTLTFVGAKLTITARPVTVTADAKTKVYGDANPAFTYQITSGSLAFSDAFTGALSRTTGESVAGSPYAITQGTIALNANYTLTFVGASLTITPRPVTVTADAKTKIYGDTDPALTYQITSGSLAFSDAFTGALTRAPGETVAGSPYAITQGTLALSADYNLTFVGPDLTITARPITVTADAKTKVYGDADPALTYQITSGNLVFSDAFTGGLTRVAGETVSAGPYAIEQGTLALSDNYALAFVGASLTITARPATVTADAQTKVYGDADPALTYQITSGNLVFSDAFTGALTRAAGENVGTHAIQQGSLTLGTNYTITFVGANLTITPRPVTVTADAQAKVYGNADPAFTYTITSGSLAFSEGFAGTLSRTAGEAVANSPYAIVQGSLTLGTNYTLSFVGASLTITPRPVTVTADAKTKVYGDADPALTYQITGGSLAFSDAFIGALTRAAGETVLGGAYAINQSTLALNANYTLTYIGANLTITTRAVTVTGEAKSKIYGDADPALTYQITSGSLAFSDAFTGALTRASGETVAGSPYAISKGTLALSTNYTLTYVGASFTITPRAVAIAADPKSKTFGQSDPALTYHITSGTLLSGDAFSGALTRAPGEAVGSYAILQGTVTLGSNYSLAYGGANLVINAWTLTGYYQPVDMPTGGMVWNTIKGGQTVPLKFQIFVGSVERTDVGAVKAFTATPTSCGTPGTEDLVEITTTGNTELRYSGGQFIQNWKTPTGANICYRTTMTAQDGSLLTAYFKTK